jgi:hypothetical protein
MNQLEHLIHLDSKKGIRNWRVSDKVALNPTDEVKEKIKNEVI